MGRCLVERENDGLSLGLPISTVPHPPGLGKVRRTLRPAVGSQSLHRCLVHIEMFIHLCCKTQKQKADEEAIRMEIQQAKTWPNYGLQYQRSEKGLQKCLFLLQTHFGNHLNGQPPRNQRCMALDPPANDLDIFAAIHTNSAHALIKSYMYSEFCHLKNLSLNNLSVKHTHRYACIVHTHNACIVAQNSTQLWLASSLRTFAIY